MFWFLLNLSIQNICVYIIYYMIYWCVKFTEQENKKSVAIIGCGAAGLAALRHFSAEGSAFTCVAYEQTDSVGGTWVYTDQVGIDKYGLPVHSSMYKSLRYNNYNFFFQYLLLLLLLDRYYKQLHLQDEFAQGNHGTSRISS